jgi:hypothetical protein
MYPEHLSRDSFAGARLKIKRAHKHIAELDTWINDVIQSNIDAARAHKAGDPSRISHHVVVNRKHGYAVDVPLIVGDAVHNLRTALDFLASAIVNDDKTRTYFPLGDTREGLIHSREYRLIEAIAPDLALKIADVIKSYKTRGDSRFWALNQLDRIDKHRLLVPTITQQNSAVIGITEEHEDDPPPTGPGSIYMLGGRTTKEGVVKSVAREPRPGTKAYIHNENNGYQTVSVIFPEGGPFENEAVVPTLRQLAELVSGVIDMFEAVCFGGEPNPVV